MNVPSVSALLSMNAAFSAMTGAVLIVGWTSVAGWLGVPTWFSVALGIGLVVFAGGVYLLSRSPTATLTMLVIAADVAWVAGAAVVIVAFPAALSTEGAWALGLASLIVADFALLQTLALRRESLGSQPAVNV